MLAFIYPKMLFTKHISTNVHIVSRKSGTYFINIFKFLMLHNFPIQKQLLRHYGTNVYNNIRFQLVHLIAGRSA